MNWLDFYLGSCIGAYVSAAVYNSDNFTKNHKPIEYVRGAIGALVWPIVIVAANWGFWRKHESRT